MKYWQFVKILSEQNTESPINLEHVDIYMAGEHVFTDMNLKEAGFLDCVGLPGVVIPETLRIKNAKGLLHYINLESIESVQVKSPEAPFTPKEPASPYKRQ